MQFTEFDEVCEECGFEVDPSELRTHPNGHDMLNPQYVCRECHEELSRQDDVELGDEKSDVTHYQEDWTRDQN